ncbi:MAG: hypothetical protein QGD94_07870 [Planctomycetia bacterium]|nr:hypothetical protein [Planctomycetia bacterium]
MSKPRVRGISMNADSVISLLAGRKTNTRRGMKEQPVGTWSRGAIAECVESDGDLVIGIVGGKPSSLWRAVRTKRGRIEAKQVRPPHAVGDHLYVREALQQMSHYGDGKDGWEGAQYAATLTPVSYRAGAREGYCGTAVWQWKRRYLPSMFMPQWAARIWLEVTHVWPERLQDISDEDAYAEGIWSAVGVEEGLHFRYGDTMLGNFDELSSVKEAYLAYWDIINGPGAAAKNPWVWAYKFKLMEGK